MFTCLLRGRSTPEMRAIDYPCLCLCFEFSQITRTTPLRCTILHLSQIFFTDARTFISLLSLISEPPTVFPGLSSSSITKSCTFFVSRLFVSIHDAPASEVIRREFHRDL